MANESISRLAVSQQHPMQDDEIERPPEDAALRILYHHRVGSKDGQAVHIESLIAAFRRVGHELCVVSPPAFAKTDFGNQSSSLARLKRLLPRAAYELLEICYNLPVFWRLERAHRRFRPDLIYERYNLFMMAGVLFARLHRTPIFLEVNAPLARERAAFGGLAFARMAAWLERCTWRAADLVLPVSQVLADIVRQAGVPPERIVVIPNGIDEEYFRSSDSAAAKRDLGLQGKTVLGFIGFVRDWHGLDGVLDLLGDPRCPPDLHLLVIGDGPALPGLKARAQRLGLLPRVTFTGLVDREGLAHHMAAFDIALQPKSVDYASPLKIFEYMAAGKAIVAPDQPNIREILVDSQSARLFTSGDDAAFAEAVLGLAREAPLRECLGAGARRTILERGYTWADNAGRIGALHSRLRQSRREAAG
jgi:glycosyltransferase involved in cell wall biosynthesis